MLTERGSTSGVHKTAGGGFRVGRAVSGAIGATWSIGSGTDGASIGADRLIDVGVDRAVVVVACNIIVGASCLVMAVARVVNVGIIAMPIGAAG